MSRSGTTLPTSSTDTRRIDWALFLAGPVLWLAHFSVVYLLAEAVCAAGGFDDRIFGLRLLSFLTLAATAIAAGATLWCTRRAVRRWRDHQRAQPSPSADESGPTAHHEAGGVLALAGALLGGVFVVAILFVGVPALFLTPC